MNRRTFLVNSILAMLSPVLSEIPMPKKEKIFGIPKETALKVALNACSIADKDFDEVKRIILEDAQNFRMPIFYERDHRVKFIDLRTGEERIIE